MRYRSKIYLIQLARLHRIDVEKGIEELMETKGLVLFGSHLYSTIFSSNAGWLIHEICKQRQRDI